MIKKLVICSAVLLSCSFLTSSSVGHAEENLSKNVKVEVRKGLAEVSTPEELKAALIDSSISEISLLQNIDLKETIITESSNKIILGNQHKINANRHQIKVSATDANYSLKDLSIENTDIYGVFWSDQENVVLKVNNVNFDNGHQFTYLPKGELQVEGYFHCVSDLEEGFQGNKLTILPGADAHIQARTGYPQGGANAVDMVGSDPKIVISENSKLKVMGSMSGVHNTSNLQFINRGDFQSWGFLGSAIKVGNNGAINFEPESNTKLSGSNGIEAGTTDITVKNGATFVTDVGNKNDGALVSNGTIMFEEGSNFKISNNSIFDKSGTVFGSYGGKSVVKINSSQGIKTWERGRTVIYDPTMVYTSPVSEEISLVGKGSVISQEFLSSTNQEFKEKFSAKDVGKIVGGTFFVEQ